MPAVLGLAGYDGRGSSFVLAAIWSDFRYGGTRGSINDMPVVPRELGAQLRPRRKDHDSGTHANRDEPGDGAAEGSSVKSAAT
jgi:hypothetical protein